MRALSICIGVGLLALVGSAGAVESSPLSPNGGLAPCTSQFSNFNAEIDRLIDPHVHGRVLASYTQVPAFDPEWGVRVYERQGEYRLLVARFQASVWHSAHREVEPSVFARDSTVPPPGLWINDVHLSADAAGLLKRVISQEVDGQRANIERLGADGEIDTFKDAHGHCAATWSPEVGARAAMLGDVFGSLKVQAMLPWRPLQFARERYVTTELYEMSGESMTTNPYLILLAALSSVALIACLPLLMAALTLIFPNRPRRKVSFIIWSGIISYGLTGLLGIVIIPLIITGAPMFALVIPTHPMSGTAVLASVFNSAPGALLLAWLLLSLVVPIYLRMKGWRGGGNVRWCTDLE